MQINTMDLNQEKIEGIRLYNLKIPITKTYHLSFGDVNYFETTIAEVSSAGNRTFGESTPLPGYGHETNKSVWDYVTRISRKIINMEIENAIDEINKKSIDHPFASSSLLTALEMLVLKLRNEDFFDSYGPKKHGKIPLVYPITAYDREEIIEEIKKAREQGYGTIKIKIASPGHSIQEDIDKISFISERAPKARIRIDANQGLKYSDSVQVLKAIGDLNIELLEQPFPVNAWEKMKKLYHEDYGIPLMLDESIESERDIIKAREFNCADYVKFKLMKQMSFENLFSMMDTAFDSGFDIIMGNGVQGEIGCIYEAWVLSTLEKLSAGENNGFLKQKEPLLHNTITMERDSLLVEESDIRLNHHAISKYLVEEMEIGK